MVPPFTPDGYLPPGIHACGWQDLSTRFALTPRRLYLIGGLREAAKMLQQAGCTRLYLDGSFASTKGSPGDFDGCWSTKGVDEDLIDPVLFDFDNGRFNQKATYGGELFPAELIENGTGLIWLDFFQQDSATGNPKGILLIDLTQDIP